MVPFQVVTLVAVYRYCNCRLIWFSTCWIASWQKTVLLTHRCDVSFCFVCVCVCVCVFFFFFFVFFSFTARQDDFTHFESSQSVGGAKTGDPREKKAELGTSHM